MKYDTNTANVDRWHGMSDAELEQGYGNVVEKSFPLNNNGKQLNGGTLPVAEDTDCGG